MCYCFCFGTLKVHRIYSVNSPIHDAIVSIRVMHPELFFLQGRVITFYILII